MGISHSSQIYCIPSQIFQKLGSPVDGIDLILPVLLGPWNGGERVVRDGWQPPLLLASHQPLQHLNFSNWPKIFLTINSIQMVSIAQLWGVHPPAAGSQLRQVAPGAGVSPPSLLPPLCSLHKAQRAHQAIAINTSEQTDCTLLHKPLYFTIQLCRTLN